MGDWILTITDNVGGDTGTLDEVCVRLFGGGCPVLPPSGVTCVANGTDVDLAWTNGEVYDSIDVSRDGMVITTLGGTATSFTDVGVPLGAVVYSIIGNVTAEGCGTPSSDCATFVAGSATDFVWAPVETAGSAIDDPLAITTALTNAGVDFVQDVNLPGGLNTFSRVWVLLGTFPANHVLTAAEGQILRDFAVNDDGCIYLSGGDHFAFDAPTALAEVDGVDNLTSFDGACVFTAIDGADTMIGVDLSAFVAVAYDTLSGDCDFIDEFAVDDGVAAWSQDLGPVVGAFHDGTASVTMGPVGNYRVFASSIEFGGLDPMQQDAIMTEILAGLDCGGGIMPGDNIIRADVNADGAFVALIDALFLLNYGFNGGPPPPCLAQADANGDRAVVSLIDALFILNFGFSGGPPPPPPHPMCGPDANGVMALGCLSPACP